MGKRENNNKKQSIFKITSFQENNEVTGSCTLVEVDGLNILLDFGGVQNDRIDFSKLVGINRKKCDLDLSAIDSIILSHAHA